MAQQPKKQTAPPARKTTRKKKSASPPKKYPVDMSMVEEILKLMEAHEVAEFEVEQEDIRLKLRKTGGETAAHSMPAHPPAGPSPAPAPSPAPPEKEAPEPIPDESATIKSPMVGTFYLTPAPDSEPFVKTGDKVTEDSVVCIIEAMKVMNEIKAETRGEIVKILVENGEMVEYGQPLFAVKPG